MLSGGADNDYLGGGCRLANAGNGYIYEQSGCNSHDDKDDTLYGGAGDDVLNGDTGNDKLYGDDGDDYLTGNSGREDRLYGGNGNDALFESGDDEINSVRWHKAYGNGGDDILFTYHENSQQHGGSGNDVSITSSTEYEAKIEGGKNSDYIWTADALPQGSCGKGDDKGVLFLDSCEGITWVDDWQGLLSKVDKKVISATLTTKQPMRPLKCRVHTRALIMVGGASVLVQRPFTILFQAVSLNVGWKIKAQLPTHTMSGALITM